MRMKTKVRVGLATAAAGAMTFAVAAPAHADYAPSASDAVGVGSDTVQYLMNFGADGDTAGDLGYNGAGNVNKLVSFDATPDANARAGYLNGSTNSALLPLNPTIVLRAGTNPIQRPNGSGAGIAALLADTGTTAFPHGEISYVRASRLPTSAEETTAGTEGFGGLHVVKLGTEDLELAELKTGSNAVPMSAAQLYHVYQCDAGFTHWNDSGIGGTSSDAIDPIIPQSGSGTRSTFLTDIETAAGQTSITLGGCVKTSEENDPTAITSGNFGPSADAIAPFSGSRLNLYNANYFHNPATAYPGGAALAPGIKMDTGTVTGPVPTGSTAPNVFYDDNRGLFIVFKQSDLSSAIPFQPGGSKNLWQTLFSGSNPYFKSGPGQALVVQAGATGGYSDCGVNPTSC
jgi:ABC-type phosphate transport system substrate-binding protein